MIQSRSCRDTNFKVVVKSMAVKAVLSEDGKGVAKRCGTVRFGDNDACVLKASLNLKNRLSGPLPQPAANG